jgi:hypothetical protein
MNWVDPARIGVLDVNATPAARLTATIRNTGQPDPDDA